MPYPQPEIRPVRDLRNNYAEIAKIVQEHRPVYITNNGRGSAVLVNWEDYADYENYIREKYILEKLKESEEIMKQEGVKWHSFEQTAAEMRGILLERLQDTDD